MKTMPKSLRLLYGVLLTGIAIFYIDIFLILLFNYTIPYSFYLLLIIAIISILLMIKIFIVSLKEVEIQWITYYSHYQ